MYGEVQASLCPRTMSLSVLHALRTLSGAMHMVSIDRDVTTEFPEILYAGTALTILALCLVALLVIIPLLVAFCLTN